MGHREQSRWRDFFNHIKTTTINIHASNGNFYLTRLALARIDDNDDYEEI